MAKLGDLVAVIGANISGFNQALGDVERNTRRMTGNIQQLGKKMSMALTGPLALIGTQSFKTFAAFEQQMAKVKAVSGATASEFAELEGNAKQLGASTRFSASEVAGLQTEFAKLGFTASEITKVTGATLALAQATDSDLARSAEVAGSTLRAFGMDASETGRVADVMALSFSSSALDMEAFAESMKYVAPVANSAGMSIEQTTAMLGALSNAGIKGSQAGTALRRIISELGATGGDVAGAIENLAKKGLNLADAKDEVGRSAQSALLVLLKEIQTVGQLETSFNNAAGSANKMSNIMDNTAEGSMARLRSAVEAAQISFGEALAPVINKVASIVSTLATKFSELSPSTQKIIAVISALVASIGPLLFILPQIVSIAPLVGAAFTAMTGPIGIAVVAVAAAVAAIVTHWDEIQAYFTSGKGSEFMNSFQESFSKAWESIKSIWDMGVSYVMMAWELFGDNYLNSIMTPIEMVMDLFEFVFTNISSMISFYSKLFQGDFAGAFDELGNVAANTVNFVIDTILSMAKVALNTADAIAKAFGGEGFYDDAVAGLEKFADGLRMTEKQAEQTSEAIDVAAEKSSGFGGFSMPTSSGASVSGGAGVRVPIEIEPIDPIAVSEALNAIETPELVVSAKVDLPENPIDPEKLAALEEQSQAIGGAVAGAFSDMSGKVVNSLGLADSGFEGFAKSLAGTATQLVSTFLAQSIAAAIAGSQQSAAATGPGAIVTSPAFLSTMVGGVLAAFASIPAFADGGVVSGPTLGLMGEYSGARNNPEVIAPLDKLRGMIGDAAGGGGGGTLTTRLKGSDLVFALERAQKDMGRNR
mgnify:FL=1